VPGTTHFDPDLTVPDWQDWTAQSPGEVTAYTAFLCRRRGVHASLHASGTANRVAFLGCRPRKPHEVTNRPGSYPESAQSCSVASFLKKPSTPHDVYKLISALRHNNGTREPLFLPFPPPLSCFLFFCSPSPPRARRGCRRAAARRALRSCLYRPSTLKKGKGDAKCATHLRPVPRSLPGGEKEGHVTHTHTPRTHGLGRAISSGADGV